MVVHAAGKAKKQNSASVHLSFGQNMIKPEDIATESIIILDTEFQNAVCMCIYIYIWLRPSTWLPPRPRLSGFLGCLVHARCVGGQRLAY